MTHTDIDIIRHGEPEGGRCFRGHGVDDPLSELGWQQMHAAVPEKAQWDLIITSPLSRCSGFAYVLGNQLRLDVISDEDFKEIGFGSWEGRTPEDIIANDGDAYERFYADPINNRPEGAEPLTDFTDRVWQAYRQLIHTHQGKRILLVTHAGVIRAIVANILGMSLDRVYSQLKIEYAAVISSRINANKDPVLLLKSSCQLISSV